MANCGVGFCKGGLTMRLGRLGPAVFALVAASVLAAHALSVQGARADDEVAGFYRDKQVSLIIGLGAGSGYDVYGRLFARYLSRHIPGNPEVVVQNMPGAASLRAVNFLYNAAPNDGTTIGIFARDMALVGIADANPQARFDVRGFTWLGSSSSYANDAHLLFIRKDGRVRTLEDARRRYGPPLFLGATSEGTTVYDANNVTRDALGLNLKIINTYPDNYAPYYATMRGEVDGRFAGLSATAVSQPDWLRPDSDMQVLLQFARTTRHKDFPDVPTARELAPNDKARALIELAELPYRLSRPFAAPPGVPKERAMALREAFLAVHRDQDYLRDAERLKVDISPIDGAEVLRVIEAMASAPAEVREYISNLEHNAPGRGHGRGWMARRLSR
jgi:tripartite-type tricarboxylate transporter receptor subunit TctC